MEILPKDSASNNFKEILEFKECYLEFCTRHHIKKPAKSLALQTDPEKLRINADQMRLMDWEALFVVLQKENVIKEMTFSSSKRKLVWLSNVDESVATALAASGAKSQPVIFTRYILQKLITSTAKALRRKESSCEKLHFELPLAPQYCLSFSQSIVASKSLSQLSLCGSCIGDEGCRYICDAVKAMPNVRKLDLSECNLGQEAMDKIVDLIRNHELILSTVAWESSFRYRAPKEEITLGLVRLTLNKNPGIGDEGASKLAACLVDDISLRAVHLQRCNITTRGALDLLGTLNRNISLRELDLDGNKISIYVMHSMKKALASPERTSSKLKC